MMGGTGSFSARGPKYQESLLGKEAVGKLYVRDLEDHEWYGEVKRDTANTGIT